MPTETTNHIMTIQASMRGGLPDVSRSNAKLSQRAEQIAADASARYATASQESRMKRRIGGHRTTRAGDSVDTALPGLTRVDGPGSLPSLQMMLREKLRLARRASPLTQAGGNARHRTQV